MLQFIKARVSSKMSVGIMAASVLVSVFAGVLAPRANHDAKAENCVNPPTTPEFNPYPLTFQNTFEECKDFPLIRIRTANGSYPTSSAQMAQGVTAQAGDELYVTMYIHNGAAPNLPREQTLSKDVKLTTIFGGSNGNYTIEARATSPNTDGINQFYKVTTGANDRLEVIPNSGERFDSAGNLQEAGFQMGDNIALIGDLDACFNFARFYRFRVRVVGNTPQPQNTSLTITKEVRDVTKNGTFATSTESANGNTVEYRIRVRNSGNATANGVVVNDSLNNTGINPTGQISVDRSYSGQLMGNGLNLGNLAVNETATITYTATVTRDSITVTNTAAAQATNATRVQASAVVTVPAPSKGNLTITKYVRQLNGSFQKSVTVQNNETVEYRVVVGVNSGRVTNVSLTDNLPSGVTYINGTLRVDGNSVNDNVFNIPLGTMDNGQSKTITFQARATAQVNQATTTLVNTAIARGDNVSDVQDTATVIITQVIGTPNLAVTKFVRNVTQNTSLQKTVSANSGDRVQFEITVTNPGSREVTNVRLNDNFTGSLMYNGITISGDASASTAGGTSGSFQATLGTLQPGQSRKVYMDGTVTFTGNGTFRLDNTVIASGDNVSSVQDSASVTAQAQGQTNLVFSKKAFNDTKNVDATTTPASREDFITYTLTVTNTGNLPANNFVITDDLSGVLPFADMVDAGGGTVTNNVITYPAVTVPAGGSVSKSFKVRVKFSLADNLTFTMVNTYGNTVEVKINTPRPTPPIETPTTGAATNAIAFGGVSVASFGTFLKRKELWKLIFS